MPSLNVINFPRSPTDVEDIAHCKGEIPFPDFTIFLGCFFFFFIVFYSF